MFLPEFVLKIFVLGALIGTIGSQNVSQLNQILNVCRKSSPNFDSCMQRAFNQMKIFFESGIPEYNILPFDPHKSASVEATRGDFRNFGFKLILRNVSEYGWTNSDVTQFKANQDRNEIVYSQYFPEKSLDGLYELNAKLLGNKIYNRGNWNLTLYDYSQTTTVSRSGLAGSPLNVQVVVDRIGGMTLHISDIFGNRRILNHFADAVINNTWKLGLPFVKPLINELVSTAFTEIFNASFRNFPIDEFIED